MATKIKICGMRSEEDISAVNEVLPDYVGFICTSRFWRYIPMERAAQLKKILAPSIQAVGVFVDEPVEYVAEYLKKGIIDIVQLHGHEDNEYIQKLKDVAPMSEFQIFQAFKITGKQDVERAENSLADLVLLDSGQGTGKPFDWELIKGMSSPYLLAGGLDTQNIQIALQTVKPYGVDVSSGVETDKKKDHQKIMRFVGVVRAFDE